MAAIIPSRQALRHLARLCGPTSNAPKCAAAVRPKRIATPPFPPSAHRALTTTSRHRNHQAAATHTHAAAATTATTASTDSTNATASPPLPDTTTNYTLFPQTLPRGPPPSGPFAIPLPSLRREFLQLQALHHPDKSPPQTPQHRQSLALSSLINGAYITLSSPLLRAQYLLQHLYDIDVTSEDNSQNITDQGTLMEVMEAQEAVEEAANYDDVEALKAENDDRMKRTEVEMGKAFEAEDVQGAKRECLKLKYWSSLAQVLKDWEPGKEVRLVH